MDRLKMLKELKADEGFVPHAYTDSLGLWTIGYGRLIDKKKKGGITEDEADYLLENDVNQKWAEVRRTLPWVTDQPETVQRALLNMAFQMGVNGLLGFKTSLKYIKLGKYDEARISLSQSKWMTQTKNRAERVISMIKRD